MGRIELVVVVACCFGCGDVFQSKFDIRPRLNNTTLPHEYLCFAL